MGHLHQGVPGAAPGALAQGGAGRGPGRRVHQDELYSAGTAGAKEGLRRQDGSALRYAPWRLQFDDDEQDEDSDERPPGPGVDPLSGWWGGR